MLQLSLALKLGFHPLTKGGLVAIYTSLQNKLPLAGSKAIEDRGNL